MPGAMTFHTNAGTTSASERLRITSAGYVQTKSELWVGGSTPVLRWRDSTHGEKATARISGSDLYFEVANQERLRITSAGDVGIGYNSPTVKLHVREGASGASSYDNRYHMICENNGEAYLGFYVPSNSFAGIRFTDNTGLEGYIDYYFNTDEMVYSSTAIHKWTTAGSERLRIDANGNAQFGGVTHSGPWSDGGAEELIDFGSGTANKGFGWGGTTANYANIWTEYSSGDLNFAAGLRPTGTSSGYVSSYGGSAVGRSNMELRLNGEILFRTASSSTVSTGSAVSTLKQKMRITSGTAVEIGSGTGSDGCGLAIYGGTNNNVSGQDAVFYVQSNTSSDWGILLNKPGYEYGMRINTPAASTLALAIYNDSNVIKHQFKGNGDYAAAGAIDSASDIKLKTNIKTIDNALDKVLQLRGAEYDRIDRDNQHEIGVIAQEVEKVIPELVHGDETKTVSYGNMTAVLIEAIKEQNEIINRMRKEIDDLKN
tara:strand:- start:4132 stop:5589 length:1458 start_codon:yes stop_codon:yes gene_type:complete